uniref:Uncharacterized protein n=1 Tax=Heterorhabditis bacteriophora TaxID=37862 RepID=A0A1I7WYC9_HETBA
MELSMKMNICVNEVFRLLIEVVVVMIIRYILCTFIFFVINTYFNKVTEKSKKQSVLSFETHCSCNNFKCIIYILTFNGTNAENISYYYRCANINNCTSKFSS